MLSANQIAGFFKISYLKKEVIYEMHFWQAGKIDSTILGLCDQACPKYSK